MSAHQHSVSSATNRWSPARTIGESNLSFYLRLHLLVLRDVHPERSPGVRAAAA